MIEFVGYLTDRAEKAFIRRTRRTALFGASVAVLFTMPSVVFIGKVVLHDNAFIYAMVAAMVIGITIIFFFNEKKEHMAMLPNRIYMDEKHIVCVANRYSDSRLVSDVKKVFDCGDYYELRFPFGKNSDKFICQKSLLTKGTLDAFEKMFEGKIIYK